MNGTILLSVMLSFAISVVLGPLVIPFLRRLKVGQTERTEGPESHLKKNGTPTMGGILFLVSVVATSLLFVKEYPRIVPILFLTLGFGLIGFLDDYIKVVLKRSMGLRAWQKFALQIVVTGIFVFYLRRYTDVSLAMKVPFVDSVEYSDSFLYRDRHSKWYELYGWSGWSGKFGDGAGGHLFYCGCHRNGKRYRAYYLRGGRGAAGILVVQCASG